MSEEDSTRIDHVETMRQGVVFDAVFDCALAFDSSAIRRDSCAR